VTIDRRDLLELLQAELLGHLKALRADPDDEIQESTSKGVQSGPRDAATLSKELRAGTAELEQLAPVKESRVDDLTQRRAARRAAAAG
jgi:hypothetical protein